MQARLKSFLETLRSDFWPLPFAFALVSLLLAELSLFIDRNHSTIFEDRLFQPSVEGLRAILTTTASGTLTLSGLVFSSTVVALTLASSQLGPRLLHNFIRARCNQITLGVLLGNFIFALVILRETRADFLPHFSVFLSFASTLFSLGTFIYFVHFLVRSLQAGNVVASVADSLQNELEKTFTNRANSSEEEKKAESERESWEELENEKSVCSIESGYLQLIHIEGLVEGARELDCRIRLFIRPGQPVLEGTPVFAYESNDSLSRKSEDQLRSQFVFGRRRTTDQDFEFSLRQLVEVGIRSLSPGINDPFTAMNCIDLLTMSMAKIARRDLQNNTHYDNEGVPRVRTRPLSFRNLLHTSFLQIRHDGSNRPDVTIRLLESLLLLVEQTTNGEQTDAVVELADLIRTGAQEHISSPFDRECISRIYSQITREADSRNEME